jgi:peptidoglycan/xylan/chitin deacetylase (PgdA/CDA1 family)
VSPAHFAEHLEVLRRRYHPMSLADLDSALDKKSVPHRGVVVTFDDGYADNLWNARPLLERVGVPATVFVTTGYVGQKREFWWDELERILLTTASAPERLELELGGRRRVFSTRTADERRDAYESIRRWLLRMDARGIEQALSSLRSWATLRPIRQAQGRQAQGHPERSRGASDDGEARPSHRPLGVDELRALAADGLVEIGAHSRSHVDLAAQPLDAQREEIEGSRRDLEAWLERPVTKFAYPFGSRASYSKSTVRAVQEAGFRLACSNFPIWVTRWTDRYQLRRCLVRDWDGETFRRQLEAWFHGQARR